MDILIVYFYDGSTDRWQYNGIANNEVLCRGFIERADGSRDMGIVTVAANCATKSKSRLVGGRYDISFDEFWANCESYNQAFMCKLVEELFPNDNITITNIINLD